MPLTPGQTLTHYQILAPLGAGGMGEVYRARDTRLEREVAIKVLPEHFADDEDRLRRFEREAKTLASLNHPNVAGIHGIDQVDDVCFLAMELVPGEDLAERLARGPLPVDETIEVCRQIADGLAAAHDSGVVHRDLKPANVRITPEGTVKLLDFGLAKPSSHESSGPETPSVATPDSFFVTEEGLVLGTPTYMSPEQARGKPVDRRTDVWAFGCVLFECLTGKRAFDGESVADVLGAIMKLEPELERLPASTPARLVELVRRSLAKDPRKRLQHLGDARLELEQLSAGEGLDSDARSAPTAPTKSSFPWAAALVLGLALGALATHLLATGEASQPAPAPPPTLARLSIPITPVEPQLYPRIAPDGRSVVYGIEDRDERGAPTYSLVQRSLDAVDPVRLPGTLGVQTFAFSPDGRSLAVVRSQGNDTEFRVDRIDLDAGPARAIPIGRYAPEPNLSSGIAWTEADELVTTGNHNRLLSLPVEGGTWREVAIGTGVELGNYVPDVYRALPGGRYVLGNAFEYRDTGYEPWVVALEVETGEQVRLVQGGQGAWFPPGKLLLSRGTTLYAVDFDPATLEVSGTPQALLDGLRTDESWKPGWFDVARDGTLTHMPGGLQGTSRRLVVTESGGETRPWSAERRSFDGMLRIDRQASFLIVGVAATSGLIETWGSEVDQPLLRPLVSAPSTDFMPGPVDAERGVFYFTKLTGGADDGVWRAPLDTPDRMEPVWVPEGKRATVMDILPDGSALFVRQLGENGIELHEVRLDGGEPRGRSCFVLDADTWNVEVSPDGKWISFSMRVDGQRTIVLREVREDGSFGPVIPVPPYVSGDGSVRGRYWWAKWQTRSEAGQPTLLLYSPSGNSVDAIRVQGDGRPSFSPAKRLAPIENRALIDFVGLSGERVMMVVRDEEELLMDRIELVLGTRALLGD